MGGNITVGKYYRIQDENSGKRMLGAERAYQELSDGMIYAYTFKHAKLWSLGIQWVNDPSHPRSE